MPVGIAPEMSVHGQTVTLGIKVADLAITEDMIWLGAEVTVEVPKDAVKAVSGRTPPPAR